MTLVREYQPTFVLGDGETKEFSYLFEEVSENFIKVIVKHSDDSTYTPVFSVDLDSHKVVFGESETAPLDTDIVCIYRETPDLQDTPFRTLQGYDAKALENILSKIVAMIQELKANGFSTQILQGTPWQLDLLHPADDGASLIVDYNARILKKGLYFQIVSGNLQVSADGNSFISMPKSADITEFRRLETVLEDLTVQYRLQYKVDGVWYNADAYTGEKADEAIEIAKEARTIATGAKEVADEAKEIAEGIDAKAQQALDNSVEAVETAEEAKNMIQNQIIVRSATMPTPSADLVGKNYQYAGTTNSLYTHNYIYECQATEINTLTFTPNTISCDWANLQTFLETIVPGYSDDVVSGTMTYLDAGDLWAIVFKNANGDTVTSYQQYTGDWEQIGFSFAGSFADGDVVSFERNTTTTYAWVRVDVQPDRIAQIQALQADITDIQALIPAQASPTNELGDKNFINSSIATNTANFIGTFNSVAELEAYSGTVTNNDYAFVIGTDSAGNTTYNRYKYTTATTPASWVYEYTLNNSSFTAAQWAAINSGVTASDVSKARSAVQPSDLGNGRITFTQGGETRGSFTTNQGNDITIDLDAGGGGSGLNVGDIFYTMRNDNELNGAVECDGATYNTTDFTGAQSIGALLEAGKIDYISLTDYATAISTKGWCDKIGWNGAGTTSFKVPTLTPRIIQTNNIPVVGNGMVLGLSNGTVNFGCYKTTQNSYPRFALNSRDYGKNIGESVQDVTSVEGNDITIGITTDSTKSGIIANTSDTAQLRVMIQLAVATTDEALETCTGVLADVAALKYDYVVDFQAPTASNNYTWFRKYKSGWIEQGGIYDNGSLAESFETTITMPVVMSNNMYSATATASVDAGSSSYTAGGTVIFTHSTTQLGIAFYRTSSGCKTRYINWQVSGMSAS